VVGEGLAMCVTLRTTDGSWPFTIDFYSIKKTGYYFLGSWYFWSSYSFYRRKYVPWCISNGEEWLFGLLTESSRGVESYRLPILSLRERSRKADLETLFKLLIIWVSIQVITCGTTQARVIQTAIPDRLIMNLFFVASEGIVWRT
jgi:hypothetical protein